MIMKKKKLRKIVNEAVQQALKEWESGVEYLHSPEDDDGRYYCSRMDCEGVRFQSKHDKPKQ